MMKHSNLEKGVLIISVDLELAWGFNYELLNGSKVAEKYLRIIKERSRRNIEKLLEVSERFNVPFTWGVVGHLFLSSCSRDKGYPHSDMPRPKLDVNKDWYANDPCSSINEDPLWYGSDIIKQIMQSKVEHEIACHTFSHVDFSRCSREVALAEARKCKEVMKDYGLKPSTFIFPKNRIGHLDVLRQEGFRTFRFKAYFCQNSTIRIIKETVSPHVGIPISTDDLIGIPSSLLFQSPHYVEALRLLIACYQGIRKAADNRGIFHIIMHDYLETDYLIEFVSKVLAYATSTSNKGKLNIMNMYAFYKDNL